MLQKEKNPDEMAVAKCASCTGKSDRTMVLSRGRVLCMAVVLASLLVSSTMAAGFEEMSFFGLMNTCKFRSSMFQNICCGDQDCPSHSCCELYFIYGGFSAQGKCVRRDPVTMLCSRRRSCRRHSDCGTGECCRLAWKGENQGVCDSFGRHGHVCTTKPFFVKNLPVVCACDVGHACKALTYMDVQGTCLSTKPTTTTTSTTTTTTTKPTTTTTVTTTTTTIPSTTTTTPSAETTTTMWPPCSQCLDLDHFCCLNDQCRIRPTLGEECGTATCPCQANTSCSHPTSPDQTGLCLSSISTTPVPTTAPPATTTATTISTTTIRSTTTTSAPSTTAPATTSTPTPTTLMTTTTPETPTTTPPSTSTTTTASTPTPPPTTTAMNPTTTTPTTTTEAEPTTTTAAATTSTPRADSTTTVTTQMPTTTTEDPCASCQGQDPRYFCCLDGQCRIRPAVGQACGANTCQCQGDATCSVPVSPDSAGTCRISDNSNLVN